MAGKKFDITPVGQVIAEAYLDRMGSLAYASAVDLEEAVTKVYSGFFQTMISNMGKDTGPHWAPAWGDITDEWSDAKGSYGSNDFYVGIGPKNTDTVSGRLSYRDNMGRRDPEKLFGPVKVTLEVGNQEYDASKVKQDISLGRFRYNGRFATPESLGMQIRLDSFPKIKKERDLAKSFTPRTKRILHYNEPFGAPSKSARPFLQPLYEYYRDVKLPGEIKRIIR